MRTLQSVAPNIELPGSKSMTNRALLIASLANGKTVIKNALMSDDTIRMQTALAALGIKIRVRRTRNSNAHITVHGSGGFLRKPGEDLDCGDAGTVMRFLTALTAAQNFEATLTGSARMRQRPLKDLEDALVLLGVRAKSNSGYPPITVQGPFAKTSCTVKGNISSQFLSGLLIAMPLMGKKMMVHVDGPLTSKPYVDMTIGVMKRFGVRVKRNGYRFFIVPGRQRYRNTKELSIEGDASSASYFKGIELLTGFPVRFSNLNAGSIQGDMKFLDAIKKMQPTTARPHELRPLSTYDCNDFPDAAMTLAVLCAFAKGKSVLTGLSNLRVKESDRLHALAAELTKIGCRTKEHNDGLAIYGDPAKLHGAFIHTHKDHRMAMCFGMTQVILPDMRIQNPSCVRKTYPSFWTDLEKVKFSLNARNIVLIGMRGSGKTELGLALAKRLRRAYIDMDEEIVRAEKKSIPQVVAEKGWNYFRDRESYICRKLGLKNRAVIGTGGGFILRKHNIDVLKQNGIFVLLEAPLKILQKRITNSTNRPSLTDKKNHVRELRQIYNARKNLYRKYADCIIDTSLQSRSRTSDMEKKVHAAMLQIARLGTSA